MKVYNEMSITNQGIFRRITNHTFNVKNDSVEKKLYIQVNPAFYAK